MSHVTKKSHKWLPGFTLAEILLTLVIIGIVSALAVPMLGLRQKRLAKPETLITNHGNIECYYDDKDVVHMYVYDSSKARIIPGYSGKDYTAANNEQTRTANIGFIEDGACFVFVPKANAYIMQAIGAGGDGAVLSGNVSYTDSPYQLSQNIPTSTDFLATMNDKVKVPDWVRKNWSKLWNEFDEYVTYTIESPMGASGAAKCQYNVKTDSAHPGCADLCAVYIQNSSFEDCPYYCLDTFTAKGGNSGQGAVYKFHFPLDYSPDGTNNADVTYHLKDGSSTGYGWNDKEEVVLNFNNGKYAAVLSSEPGESGYFDPSSCSSARAYACDGANGEGYDTFGSDRLPQTSGAIPIGNANYEKVGDIAPQLGLQNCTTNMNQSSKSGTIKSDPAFIVYTEDTLGVRATFGTAGEPGESVMRVYEKFPSAVLFRLVPARRSAALERGNIVIYETDDGEEREITGYRYKEETQAAGTCETKTIKEYRYDITTTGTSETKSGHKEGNSNRENYRLVLPEGATTTLYTIYSEYAIVKYRGNRPMNRIYVHVNHGATTYEEAKAECDKQKEYQTNGPDHRLEINERVELIETRHRAEYTYTEAGQSKTETKTTTNADSIPPDAKNIITVFTDETTKPGKIIGENTGSSSGSGSGSTEIKRYNFNVILHQNSNHSVRAEAPSFDYYSTKFPENEKAEYNLLSGVVSKTYLLTFILRDPRFEYYRSCADNIDSTVEGRGSSYKEAFEDATNMAPTADCIISAFAEHVPSGTVEVTTSGGSSGGPGTVEECDPTQTTEEYKVVTNKEDIPEGVSDDDIEPLYGDPKPVKKRHQCLESEWNESMGTKIKVIQGAVATEKDESSISIFDIQTGESIRIISAKSGADGTAYYDEHMPIYDGDLPFPKRYLPDSFTPKEPLQTFTGRSKYRSVLTDKKVGHSGPGAYPIIQRVTGDSKLLLKVNSEHQVGSVQLRPLSSSSVSCAEGVTKEGSNCGSPASSGSAGAASISW